MTYININEIYIFKNKLIYPTESWAKNIDGEDLNIVQRAVLRLNFTKHTLKMLDFFSQSEATNLIQMYLSVNPDSKNLAKVIISEIYEKQKQNHETANT
jgi:hypothetical protein